MRASWSRDMVSLALAPTTSGGSSWVPREFQCDQEAIHVAGFSEYGLMDLFDSPADDLDGMKEIRSGTPAVRRSRCVSAVDFKEIFMKFAGWAGTSPDPTPTYDAD